MDLETEVEKLRDSLKKSEQVQTELDRRVFYLKTLYDVSKDIFSSVDSATILRNFLLMAMGNFGVTEGFILLTNSNSKKVEDIVPVGLQDSDEVSLIEGIQQLLRHDTFPALFENKADFSQQGFFPSSLEFLQPFTIESDYPGILGLGPKLVGEPYNENDQELLDTLVNNLIIALKNARSFEKIKKLNLDLETKNVQLKKALKELKVALRKVEILEDIKANLCKFVPTTVTRLVEKSPTADILEARERDVTVLFLDIEAYTKITEELGAIEVNALVEKYFSVFMDAIYKNNGDVVETAGDGLMVLFLTDDEITSAEEAVRAARTVKEKACLINEECSLDSQPLVINMGICSGRAFVGASKFESYTGSRWTYAAHGTITNVAARICGHATGGAVLVSKSTAERTKDHFSFKPLGKFALKNLSEEVDIFELQS
jgi:class 3 adenylate cyclase